MIMHVFPPLLYYLINVFPIIVCNIDKLILRQHTFRVDEGQPIGSHVGIISSKNDKYSSLSKEFQISESGHLTTNKVFDYEKLTKDEKLYGIKLNILTGSSLLVYSITVHIDDLNDNMPTFPMKVFHIKIKEDINSTVDTFFPNAVDPDRVIEYSIVSGDTYKDFQIDKLISSDQKEEYVLKLVTGHALDVEEKTDFLNLTISACNKGSVFCNYLQLEITIEDVNDNTPVFEELNGFIDIYENVSQWDPVFKVKATDPDRGLNGQGEYQIFKSNEFRIQPHTGEVFVSARKLDAEEDDQKSMLIIAKDKGTPDRKSTAFVSIRILDCNDEAPKLTVHPQSSGPATLAEGMPIGTVIGSLTAVDYDITSANNEISKVTLTKGGDYFALERTKDEILNGRHIMKYFIKTTKEIDREVTPTIFLSATATDSGVPPLTGSVDYVVHVMDLNDNPPVFERAVYKATINESKIVGAFVIRVKATDADDGANAQISYFITTKSAQQWFYIDEDTGEIILNDVIDREEQPNVTIDIAARDHGRSSLTNYARVVVTILDTNDNDPVFVDRDMKFTLGENNKPDMFIGTFRFISIYFSLRCTN